MYFPYLRGRQFELIALRELLENDRIGEKVIPIIEPVKPSATLLKTLDLFVKKNREIAIVLNPQVSEFVRKIKEMRTEKSKLANDIHDLLAENHKIIKAYIMSKDVVSNLRNSQNKSSHMIINTDRAYLDDFLEVYDNVLPRFTLIPNDRAFKKVIDDYKVLFGDRFSKKSRNVDYIGKPDEFFSDDHLFYREENYIGFSDYSIVGEEFNEAGFAPFAVAIHLVYFDQKQSLNIHHFVSDSNEGIEDPGGKFGEALNKLISWCERNSIEKSLGLKGFYECYNSGKYPGLGTAKKYSIMHHIELVSNYLEKNEE